MTLLQKIQYLREERYHDLNDWEKEFVSDMYEGTEGIPSESSDEDTEEYLTTRQVEKLEEICEELGI